MNCVTCDPGDHPRQWTHPPGNPPRHRTIVLCFDGKRNSCDEDNSNVSQLVAMLKRTDPTEQLVYYQPRAGTPTIDVLERSIFTNTPKPTDIVISNKTSDHIKRAYLFLMDNRLPGDNICLFGFSHGAIIARALAGMIHKVGLLPRRNLELLLVAYDLYTKKDKEGLELSARFRETFCVRVGIKFLGVWDSVNPGVGLIEGTLPFFDEGVSVLRHALALDERRVKFRPFFYVGKLAERNGEATRGVGEGIDFDEVFFAGVHSDVGGGSVKNGEPNSLARIPLRWMIGESFKANTGIIFDACMLRREAGLDMIEEMGEGGGVDNDKDIRPTWSPPNPLSPSDDHSALAMPKKGRFERVSFWSLILAAVIWGFFSPFRWAGYNLRGRYTPLTPRSEQKHLSEGEAEEEQKDALSPIYDQVKINPWWEILEFIPWVFKRQSIEDLNNPRPYGWIRNRKKGRVLYKEVMGRGIRIHRSVKTRMLAEPMEGTTKKYRPKVRFMIDGKVRRLEREEWLPEDDADPVYFDWVD